MDLEGLISVAGTTVQSTVPSGPKASGPQAALGTARAVPWGADQGELETLVRSMVSELMGKVPPRRRLKVPLLVEGAVQSKTGNWLLQLRVERLRLEGRKIGGAQSASPSRPLLGLAPRQTLRLELGGGPG
jgi:hypothetical protein